MTRIEFTEEEIEKLRYERFHHPHPRVQQKMEALLLKSQGVPHWQICEILAITENTLRAYLQAYLEGGVEKLKELKFPCPQSELAAHAETLEGYFREHPPATIKEAVAKIEELTGIRRSETQVRQFLKSLGMRRLKLGAIPAKADPEKQAIFKKRGTRSAAGRSPSRSPGGVLRRRGPFRVGAVSRVFMVFRALFHESACRQTTLQCAGRPKRGHA